MGKLPSLGLSRYVASDFRDETRNPFTVQTLTEKMLVMRELEREYGELNKYHNDGKLIHEKPIQTRVDRCGALRRIKEIPHRRDERLRQKQKGSAEVDDASQPQNKINIFDAQNSQQVNNDVLTKIGLNEQQASLVEETARSSISRASSHASLRPKAIEYLKKRREQSETARDFIQSSRQILRSQISINDKTEETELLREYIIMEKEKLDEGQKTFQEDKDKYEKFKQSLAVQANHTEEALKAVGREIESLQTQILDLKKEESMLASAGNKCVEDLHMYKRDKTFLDLLAISDGLKQVQVKASHKTTAKPTAAAARKDNTFMTSVKPA